MTKWEKIHDLKAYHAYRQIYRQIKEGGDKRKLCEELSEDKDFMKSGIKKSSIDPKIENYRYIDTMLSVKGLSGCSKQALSVYLEYRDKDIKDIEKAIHDMEKKPD